MLFQKIGREGFVDKSDIWAGRLKGNEGASHVDVWKKREVPHRRSSKEVSHSSCPRKQEAEW